jgi:hypothetical protein
LRKPDHSPLITDDPVLVIQESHQESIKDNERVLLSVEQYFKSIQMLTNFLSKTEGAWSISVIQNFINHVTSAVHEQIHSRLKQVPAMMQVKDQNCPLTGGHFSLFYTLQHPIPLHFHWPNMFQLSFATAEYSYSKS